MVAQVRSSDEWKSEFTANGSTKIEWLVGENPKRPSGQSYARFASYFGTTTVAEYLARGGTKGDLKYDWEKSFLDLQLPATETAAPIELLEQDPLTVVEEALPVLEGSKPEDDFAEFAPVATDAAAEILEPEAKPTGGRNRKNRNTAA